MTTNCDLYWEEICTHLPHSLIVFAHSHSWVVLKSYLAGSQSIRLVVIRGLCGPVAIVAKSKRRLSAPLDPTGSSGRGRRVGWADACCVSASTALACAASNICFLLDSIFLCRGSGQSCTGRPRAVSCMESVSSFSDDERRFAEPSHSAIRRKPTDFHFLNDMYYIMYYIYIYYIPIQIPILLLLLLFFHFFFSSVKATQI